MLKSYLRNTLNPAHYHGHNAKPPFFEGWYYKLVDKKAKHSYAIIPGVSLSDGGGGAHAFVQVLDGITGETAYYRYPIDEFWAAERSLYLTIGPNYFTKASMNLELPSLKGEVVFYDMVPWPATPVSPGIMGWYSWVPGMECYHDVVSFDHSIYGTLDVDGKSVELTGGRGYIEKDWGQAFPAAWVWMQSNHFSKPGSCITASVAMVPWAKNTFRGFIVGFLHDGILYRFASYTGAVIESLEISAETITWVLRDKLYRLCLTAQREKAGILHGPSYTDMERRVPESLQATISVQLMARHNNRIIFEDTGHTAGLEVAGEVQALMDATIGDDK